MAHDVPTCQHARNNEEITSQWLAAASSACSQCSTGSSDPILSTSRVTAGQGPGHCAASSMGADPNERAIIAPADAILGRLGLIDHFKPIKSDIYIIIYICESSCLL